VADLREVVGAHQPHETRAWRARLQRGQRVGSKMRPEPRFKIEDADAGIAGGALGTGDAFGKRRHAGDGLQRILRRDQPPNFVEAEAFQGFEADMAMAIMGGVERAAEQPDAAFRQMVETERIAQGRTWPLPRTTYL
jgi:hypothetical protein